MNHDDTTQMSDEEISDALADLSGERYNPHVRLDEPGEDDCVVERIEMDFAIPVYLTHRHQRMLHDLAGEICDYPPNIPLAGVHWPSGYGSKPRWSKADVRFLGKDAKQIDPDAPESGEPTFDDTVLFLETSARGFVSDEERKRKVEARVQTGAASKPDSVVESEQHVVLTCVYCGHQYPPGTPAAMHPILTEHIAQCDKHPMRAVVEERDELRARLDKIAATLEKAVCTEGCDKGVVLLSEHGATHIERIDGRDVQVYDHEHFSPLGDALIAAWELARNDAFAARVNQDTQAVAEEAASPPDLSRVQSGWASPEAVDEMRIAVTNLRAALHFIADLTGEALETARVGTGEEIALRHAHRRAKDALEGRTQ